MRDLVMTFCTGWIAIGREPDGKAVYVRMSEIAAFFTDGDYRTRIHLHGGQVLDVSADITRALAEALEARGTGVTNSHEATPDPRLDSSYGMF